MKLASDITTGPPSIRPLALPTDIPGPAELVPLAAEHPSSTPSGEVTVKSSIASGGNVPFRQNEDNGTSTSLPIPARRIRDEVPKCLNSQSSDAHTGSGSQGSPLLTPGKWQGPPQPCITTSQTISDTRSILPVSPSIAAATCIKSPGYIPRPFVPKVSAAAQEWQQQMEESKFTCEGTLNLKTQTVVDDSSGESSEDDSSVGSSEGDDTPDGVINRLMEMVGLEQVKTQFLAIKSKVEISRHQNANIQKERFHAVFQGNPGTGKTTVARLYAKFLHSLGVLTGTGVHETSGAKIGYHSPQLVENTIDRLVNGGGGVLFVDEAYQLTAQHTSTGGAQALDLILTEMENNLGKLVVIFVGYNKEMESFFEHNPGLSSRIPYRLQFEDFEDVELWKVLCDRIKEKYKGEMKVEGGLDGLYMRITVRRLARGRKCKGFGNARAVENLLATISERQAKRLRIQQRKARLEKKDYLQFTKEDLIGPDPSEAIQQSVAWKKLGRLVGLDSVKSVAKTLIETIQANYIRELQEQPPLEFCLNKVFLGSPGTGKTTVAQLYGQILADIGLLSKGEVIIKNPSDFVGQCLGKSEANTKAILAATVGKVLIIDEAYGLNSGSSDSYKAGVIDTLVAEVQGVPGDDRCVLLLGYEDKLREMFQSVNPGLSRRFPIDQAFHFEDFTLEQLNNILRLKLEDQGLKATPEAMVVAMEMLERARMRPNFSNAGEVNICIDRAKQNYLVRQVLQPVTQRRYDGILEAVDFDPEFNRKSQKSTCREYLKNRLSEKIIRQLESYQELAMSAKEGGIDSRTIVPTRFIFKGPPGTGKTTAALHMGKVFYDLGFLSSSEVVECSATDLIGQFVGSTAPKTKAQLERGLGKVLFVDDAYRLAQGQYATEAVNEMINLLSKPEYMRKMIVILAGKTRDMDGLMAAQPYLSSHFPHEIIFENIEANEAMIILRQELDGKISAPVLQEPLSETGKGIHRLFGALKVFPSWGNARDIKNVADQMIAAAIQGRVQAAVDTSTAGQIKRRFVLSAEQAIKCMTTMFEQQYRRSARTRQSPSLEASERAVESVQQRTQCPSKMNTSMEGTFDTVSGHNYPRLATRSNVPTIYIADPDGQEINPLPDEPGEQCAEIRQQQKITEERQESILQKLGRLAPCPNGFVWNVKGNGYCCAGGSHTLTAAEADKRMAGL